MMREWKCISIFLVLFVSSAFAQQEDKSSVTIEVINHSHSPRRSVRHIYVKRQEQELLCRTDNIPEHAIKISGFPFQPPFKNEPQHEPDCMKTIRWGKTETCYKPGTNRILDELFRQCFGF